MKESLNSKYKIKQMLKLNSYTFSGSYTVIFILASLLNEPGIERNEFALRNKNTFLPFKSSNEFCLVVVVVLLFYVHGKHLRSCRDGQLT